MNVMNGLLRSPGLAPNLAGAIEYFVPIRTIESTFNVKPNLQYHKIIHT